MNYSRRDVSLLLPALAAGQATAQTPALERFLAGIYVDAEARVRFLAAPYEEAKRAGLSEEQCRALEAIDRVGLEMAAHSLSRRRARHAGLLLRLAQS